MGHKVALFITAGLTAFVIGAGGLLSMSLNPPQETPTAIATEVTPTSAPRDTTIETLLGRDALYRTRMEEANGVIQQANTIITTLQGQNQALQEQNKVLLEREALYRQEIERANSLLQQLAEGPPAAASMPEPAPGTAVPTTPEHEDDHENDQEDDYEEENDDDD